ncbi:MAG: penicillin-binding protein 1C [Treponema sp.]|jgi:penicillin-binding protein 1C|nr:penicillin-binding protein 1C [Treponema sp.]
MAFPRLRTLLILIPVLILALFLAYQAVFLDPLEAVSFSRAYTDREGWLLNIFLTEDDKYRLRTPLADVPPALVEAVLLQEDRYFYGHGGINPAAMLRAGWETYVKKSRRMGASTITMQLARLRYGLYTRNLRGKLLQSLCALFLEICLSKQEILEAYLNLAPLGGNIEGYGAAAWYYFNKDLRELTGGELLTLAVIPQNPGRRAPLRGLPPELMEARSKLYESWLASHPGDSSLRTEMELPPYLVNRFPRRAIHLAEYLRPREAPPAGRTDGRLALTVNRSLQDLVEREMESYLRRNRSWGINNGSVLLLDWTSMEILAALGSADYGDDSIQGQVNGFASKRSPGSTLKPFVYALAMEQGLIHPETMLKDTPRSFSEYTPDNYQGVFKGPVKAWFALVDSRNVPAVQLAANIRNPDLHDFLKNAGITGLKEKEHYGLSAVLGAADLSMLELAGLYASLPNGGLLRSPRFFPGEPQDEAPPKRILSPQAAAVTLAMLERNPAPGDTPYAAGRRIPVAYKTGTSIGFKDAWSIAVFDRYVLAVWLGNFSGQGNPALIGRLTATPLQFSIIDAITARIPPGSFLAPRPMPEGVSPVSVCAVSGDLPGGDCPHLVDTWFIPGVSPIRRCRIHRRVYIDTRSGYRTDETRGPHIRSEVREFWPTDVLEIFAQAGLPRFLPPPYPPAAPSRTLGSSAQGFPPSIISPLGNTDYILRPRDDRRNRIVLLAGADQDGGELFWFANTLFLGRAKPYERFLWQGEPGLWDLTVVDSRGRSAGLRVNVEVEPR